MDEALGNTSARDRARMKEKELVEEEEEEEGEEEEEEESSEDDEEDKHGWERMNHNGKLYFWNWDTEQTTWKRPEGK